MLISIAVKCIHPLLQTCFETKNMEKQFERYFCVIELTGNAKKSYLLTFYFWSKFFYIQPSSLDAGKRGVTLTEAHIDLHWAISSENLRSLQKPFVLFETKKSKKEFFFFVLQNLLLFSLSLDMK